MVDFADYNAALTRAAKQFFIDARRESKESGPAIGSDTLKEIFGFLFGKKDFDGLSLRKMLEAQGVESYSILLVGSRAANRHRPNSDWDINIETSRPVSDEITLKIAILNLLSEELGPIVIRHFDLRIRAADPLRPNIKIDNFEEAMKIVNAQTAEAKA